MIKMSIDDWRTELLENSKLVQDGDDTTSPEEAERRFNRFVQLVQTLVDSIQSPNDYGAYEPTLQNTT